MTEGVPSNAEQGTGGPESPSSWTRTEKLLAAIAGLLAIAILGGAALGLGGLLGGGDSGGDGGIDARSAAPSLDTGFSAESTAVCLAFNELRDAQNEHGVPLGTRILEMASDMTGEAFSAASRANVEAIARAALRAGNSLEGLVFPEASEAIVELKRAVVGYGSGALEMRRAFDGDPSANLITGMTLILEGKTALDAASEVVSRLNAEGILPCD